MMMGNIMVTGATSGIGEAMVNLFVSRGAKVVAVGRNREKLDAINLKFGDYVSTFQLDLKEMNAIKLVFDSCKSDGVMFDGIVHCAGITLNCPLRVNNCIQTEEMLRVNFGVLADICCIASSKRYVNEGASIVAMSSTASLCAAKGTATYAASKAAVNSLVKTAAVELVPRRIRINAIAPSMVNTPMYERTIEEIPNMLNVVNSQQPLGLIEPESISKIAAWLMSDEARYITGAIIPVGAGFVL